MFSNFWSKDEEEEEEPSLREPVPDKTQRERDRVVERKSPSSPIEEPQKTKTHIEVLKFEDLTKESKSVLSTMELFDGFKFEINKTLNDNPPFSIIHSFGLGSATEEPNYNFAANLILENTALFSGRVDTTGNMMGRFQLNFSQDSMIRFSGQASPEPHNSGVHIETDLRGETSMTTFKWGNPGSYSLSYVQRFTPTVSLGLETFYMYKQAITVLTGGLRYETPNYISTGILNAANLALAFTRKLQSPEGAGCNLSTEMILGWPSGFPEATVQMGLEYTLHAAHVKTHFDISNWKVGALVEEALGQNVRFSLSGELDHFKKTYRFGIGLSASF